MKKIFATYMLFASAATISSALTEQTTIKVGELTDPTIWSNGAAPTISNSSYMGQTGTFTLNADLTTGKLGSNWGNRGEIIQMVDADGFVVSDPAEFHTLTIAGTGSDRQLLELRSNSGANAANDDLVFTNGYYVFKHDTISEAAFSLSTNTVSGGVLSAIKKSIVFQQNTVSVSKNMLFLNGVESSSALRDQAKFVFDGSFSLVSDTSEYKQLSVGNTATVEIGGTMDSAKVSIWGNVDFNVKSGGVLNTHNTAIAVENQSALSVAGTVNAKYLYALSTNAQNKITSGGIVNLTDSITVGTGTADNSFTIEEGGTLNTVTVYVKKGGNLYVNGLLAQSTATSIPQNLLIDAGGTLTVGKTGKITIAGGYKQIHVDGTLISNGAANSIIVPGRVRVRNGGKLILNSTNAFSGGGSETQASHIFWLYSGTTAIEINADNNIGSFAFVKDSNFTLTIGKDVNLITLDKFTSKLDSNCLDGLAAETLTFIIEGFRLDTIKINNVSALDKKEDGFLAIISDGWKDFYVDSNKFLCATAVVPEPATLAAIFGALALGLAVYRRRK